MSAHTLDLECVPSLISTQKKQKRELNKWGRKKNKAEERISLFPELIGLKFASGFLNANVESLLSTSWGYRCAVLIV